MSAFGFGRVYPTPNTYFLPNAAIIGLLGHSQVAAAGGAFANPRGAVLMGTQNTFGWGSLTSGGRYVIDEYSCAGISGSTSGDILNTTYAALGGKTQIEAVKAGRAGTFILNTGVNDVATVASLNSFTIPNFRTILRTLLARGKQVVVMTPSAKGNASFTGHRTTGEVTQFLFGLRHWILNEMPREFPRGAIPFDTFAASADPTSVNGYGDVRAGYTYDGLHMNSLGNLMVDRALVAALASVLGGTPAPNLGIDAAYPYHATLAPRGNLLANGTLIGGTNALSGTTGGVTMSGVMPSGWWCAPNPVLGNNSTMTVTGALEDTATGRWFKLSFNGTIAAGTGGDYSFFDINQNPAAGFYSVGDLLRLTAEAEIVAGSVGITNVTTFFGLTGGGGGSMTQGYIQGDFDKAGIDAAIATANLPLVFPGGLSVPVTGSAPTGSTVRLSVGFGSSPSAAFAVNGAVRFRYAKLWKAA